MTKLSNLGPPQIGRMIEQAQDLAPVAERVTLAKIALARNGSVTRNTITPVTSEDVTLLQRVTDLEGLVKELTVRLDRYEARSAKPDAAPDLSKPKKSRAEYMKTYRANKASD